MTAHKEHKDDQLYAATTIESYAVGHTREIDSDSKILTDDNLLSSIGYKAELKRSMTFAAILAAGWNACNSWAGLAASLVTAITQGGTVTVLYGEIIMLVVIGATALSVAEMASSFPTAGGQYHYSSILSPQKFSRGISYLTGCVNTFAWIVTTASVTLTIPQQILAVVVNFHPNYVFQRWHLFLGYEAVNVVILIFNIYGLQKISSLVHRTGFVLSISLFLASVLVCATRATPKQSNEFVWATFTNESGWENSVIVFLTGLINPNYMYVGIDCAIHLAEDCSNAAVAVPRAVLAVIVIGFVTTFPFTITMFYSLSDLEKVLDTVTGVPIYELWLQASRSTVGGTALMIALISIQFFATNACQQTSGRLTWSFARDRGLVFSEKLGRIDPRRDVPVWALVANASLVGLIGVLYVASTTAYNAIIGTCLILVQASYAIPVACLMAAGRKGLLKNRYIRLGHLGWIPNVVTVLWSFENLVVYCMPFEMPVTAGNMNYSVAVLTVMGLFGVFSWIFWAKKNFSGPRVDVMNM